MKLISMTEFVLILENSPIGYEEMDYYMMQSNDLDKCINYAKFLSQPLKLGMFVPCDLDGNVMEGKPLSPASDAEWIRWENKQEEFNKAQERVLFKGFEYKISKSHNSYEYIRNKHPHVFNLRQIETSTVEGLLTGFKKKYQIELTESAIKQLNYGKI